MSTENILHSLDELTEIVTDAVYNIAISGEGRGEEFLRLLQNPRLNYRGEYKKLQEFIRDELREHYF